MILKKPYAFLIKHFQKIHILLLVLCSYIFYKNSQFSAFVSDYLALGTYSETLNNVNQYASVLFYIVIISIIFISGIIIYLLRYKKKPYRVYLFIIVEYLFMFGVFVYGANFFHGLTNSVSITSVLALRDLLFISSLPQYVIFILLFVHCLGVDLQKFGFQDDKAFLGLEEKDNEEFEFEINVDKHKFKREFKKKLRYFRYFYQENRKVFSVIVVIVFVSLIGYISYYVNVSHKVYKIGDTFTANYYQIKVNQAYVTTKDDRGKLILDEKSKKKFVVLNVTVKNLAQERVMNIDRFHLLNGISWGIVTMKYNQSFTDLGKPYEKVAMKQNEEKTFLLIYQVDKELKNDRFVFAYQDIASHKTLDLKPVKLSLQDKSDIKIEQEKKVEEEMTLVYPNRLKKRLTINKPSLVSETSYFYEKCYVNDCSIVEGKLTAKKNQILLVIPYVTDDFETSELVDFSNRYGTISYIDNKGETKTISVRSAIERTYQGNYLYLSVPEEVKTSSNITLNFIVRDKKFIYQF